MNWSVAIGAFSGVVAANALTLLVQGWMLLRQERHLRELNG